jgi:hypothetical protein
MGGDTGTMAGILLVLVVLFILAFFLSRYLARRALRDLLGTFIRLKAVDPESAVASEELGIVPHSVFSLRMGLRDYRPAALRLLMTSDIVRLTADGRVYLSMAALEASSLKSYAENL